MQCRVNDMTINNLPKFLAANSTDQMHALTINSLTAIDGHDRQYIFELCSTVVSRQIFIRSQSLIAR